MSGENNLTKLLENMSPELQDGTYVFLTSADNFSDDTQKEAIMVFKEMEGMTVIVRDEVAKALEKDGMPRWAMITLTVHSDLNAVGFLAAITQKLAAAGISVNTVSAFYHDHLFVPWDKREEAMGKLYSITKNHTHN